jgi:hypothetical protein
MNCQPQFIADGVCSLRYLGRMSPGSKGRTRLFAIVLSEMYGPPSDCKGKVCGGRKSALMYPAYWWRFVLLASMRYAACLSLETPRPLEGLIGKQVLGTPF